MPPSLKRSHTFSEQIEQAAEHLLEEADNLTAHLELVPEAVLKDEGLQAPQPLDVVDAVPEPASEKPKRARLSAAAKSIVFRDKCVFTLGLLNLCVASMLLGHAASLYYVKFVGTMAFLFLLRFIVYYAKGWHYYMAEYCYWGNIQLAIYFICMPTNALLRKVVFSQAVGPLTWSIILQRNSMVLHSLDKSTSLYMHLSPAIAAWCMRWHPRPMWVPGPEDREALQEWDRASFMELCVLPILPYLAWFITYYLVVFVFKHKKIARKNYPTLYYLMTKDPNSMSTKFVKLAPEPLQPLMYMCGHAIWVVLLMLFAPLWWRSYMAHTAFLLTCILASFWNGASYYFHVFAQRYVSSLERMDAQADKSK